MDTLDRNSRMVPMITLAGVLAVLALHDWYARTEHSVFLAAIFILPPVGMLALGGIVHPPILYSIGKYGSHLPSSTRAIGVALAIAGVGVGFYLFRFVYGF